MGMDNQKHAMADRGHDSYPTPPEAVLALMGVEALPAICWEPACGAGNIVHVLRDSGRVCMASDIVDRNCPMAHAPVDFLHHELPAIRDYQAIITNPPFVHATEFIDRALTYCPLVYMLLRLNYMEGGQRDPVRDRLLNPGGGLRRVYVFRERLPMMHREGWTGNRASSMVTHAWFCWQRGYKGKAQISRISWKNPRPPLPPAKRKLRKSTRCPDTVDMFGGDDAGDHI